MAIFNSYVKLPEGSLYFEPQKRDPNWQTFSRLKAPSVEIIPAILGLNWAQNWGEKLSDNFERPECSALFRCSGNGLTGRQNGDDVWCVFRSGRDAEGTISKPMISPYDWWNNHPATPTMTLVYQLLTHNQFFTRCSGLPRPRKSRISGCQEEWSSTCWPSFCCPTPIVTGFSWFFCSRRGDPKMYRNAGWNGIDHDHNFMTTVFLKWLETDSKPTFFVMFLALIFLLKIYWVDVPDVPGPGWFQRFLGLVF